MFKKNDSHKQLTIDMYSVDDMSVFFDNVKETEFYTFYELVFCKIDEELFKDLFCENNGRPNSAINAMMSALILRSKHDWTYKELFFHLHFNIAVRAAIGLSAYEKVPFNEATLFNFQNRVKDYSEKNKINLFEKVFNTLTQDQLKTLKVKTDIARTDSLMIDSNIRKYGLLQLVIEIALRLYRVMEDSDKKLFCEQYVKYTEKTSEKYIYDIKGSDLPHEFTNVSNMYFWIKSNMSEKYKDTSEYKAFERGLNDFFILENSEKAVIKEPKDIRSDAIQSPDDLDATYRCKRGEKHHGHSLSVTETANPDNKVNLITNVNVSKNNVDDSVILNEIIEEVKEQMPDLEKIFVDGAYGSIDNDKKLEQLDITMYQSAVKGKKSEIEFKFERQDHLMCITCPQNQRIKCETTKKGKFKAVFDQNVCSQCPLKDLCPAKNRKTKRLLYFDTDYIQMKERHQRFSLLSDKEKNIRPNVEATVKEFSCRTVDHKLRVRGYFKTTVFAFTTAIAINFGRIFRYRVKELLTSLFLLILTLCKLLKNQKYQFQKMKTRYYFWTDNLLKTV